MLSTPARSRLWPALIAGVLAAWAGGAVADPIVEPLPGEPQIAPLDERGEIIGDDPSAALPEVAPPVRAGDGAALPAPLRSVRGAVKERLLVRVRERRIDRIAAELSAVALAFGLLFLLARRFRASKRPAPREPRSVELAAAASPRLEPSPIGPPRQARRGSELPGPTPLQRPRRAPPVMSDLGGPTVPHLGPHFFAEPPPLPLPPEPEMEIEIALERPPSPAAPRRRAARGSTAPPPRRMTAPPPAAAAPLPPLPGATDPELRPLPPYRDPSSGR